MIFENKICHSLMIKELKQLVDNIDFFETVLVHPIWKIMDSESAKKENSDFPREKPNCPC